MLLILIWSNQISVYGADWDVAAASEVDPALMAAQAGALLTYLSGRVALTFVTQ